MGETPTLNRVFGGLDIAVDDSHGELSVRVEADDLDTGYCPPQPIVRICIEYPGVGEFHLSLFPDEANTVWQEIRDAVIEGEATYQERLDELEAAEPEP